MCVSDWRLGSLVRTNLRAVSIGVTSFEIPANPARVGIEIRATAAAGGGVVLAAIDGVSVGALQSAFGATPLIYTMKDDGDTPTRRFTVSNAAGTVGFSIIERTLPIGVIAAGIEDFRRSYPGSNF